MPESNFKEYILKLSKENNVIYSETKLDIWCKKITELSGDDVSSDYIQDLIIELKRKNIISKESVMHLASGYSKEKRLQNIEIRHMVQRNHRDLS